MSTQTQDLPLSRDLDAEAMSLGCVFINPKALDDLRRYLRPSDYSYEAHHLIFSAMCAIADRGDMVELMTVYDWLKDHGLAERAGGLEYLTPLPNRVPESYSAPQYAQIILKHSIRRRHYDISLLHAGLSQRKDTALIAQLAEEEARLAEMLQRGRGEGAKDTPQLLGIPLSEVEVEEFQWVWHRRIALGKITTFDGDGGVGKSLATIDLVARVRMGRDMPDRSAGLDAPAGAVIICGEDGLADTVKPRLLAAGVSPEALKQVRAINLVPEHLADGTISQRLLSLLADLPRLEATIAAMGAKILVIDPITAYLGGGVDMYKDAEVRRVLTPLALMAERVGVAVVMTRHLNRSNGASAQHRGLGSVGFLNVARLGLLFAPNPDAEGEVLVSRYKGNVGAPPPTLAYRIVQVGEAENMPRISWLGERETSAGAALASQSGGDREETTHSLDEAVEFLRAELNVYDVAVTDIIERAGKIGISKRTLERARTKLKVKSYKMGFGKEAPWMLEKIDDDATKDAKSQDVGGVWTETGSNGADAPDDATKDAAYGAQTQDIHRHPQDVGGLRTETGSNGASEAVSPKDRQASEGGGLRGMNGNLRADTHEHPPADVAGEVAEGMEPPEVAVIMGEIVRRRADMAPALRRHCDYCETERNFDRFDDTWHCIACDWEVGTPVVRTTATTTDDDGDWGEI